MRATPETDAHYSKARRAGIVLMSADVDFMRKLERERDEARDLIADMTTRGTLYMEENARLKREIARPTRPDLTEDEVSKYLDIAPESFPKLFLAGENPRL